MSLSKIVLHRMGDRFFRVDEEECQALVQRLREPTVHATAEAVIEHFARKAAIRGFLIGIPASPVLAIPLSFVDTRGVTRMRAGLVASLAYLSDSRFFDEPNWRDEVILAITRRAPGPEAAPVGPARLGKAMARAWVAERGQRWAARGMARWLARRAAQRALFTKMVPIVSGAAGAAWNYFEVSRQGQRAMRAYMDTDERLPADSRLLAAFTRARRRRRS